MPYTRTNGGICLSTIKCKRRSQVPTRVTDLTLRFDLSRAFKLPITVMLDLNNLEKLVHVITVEEYLLLHGRNTSLEVGNGSWAHELYQDSDEDMFRIPNKQGSDAELFEPPGTIRVDRLPDIPHPIVPQPGSRARHVYAHLLDIAGKEGILTPRQAMLALLAMSVVFPKGSGSDDEKLIVVMQEHGFCLLHTYYTR